jgi:hypothetical protein
LANTPAFLVDIWKGQRGKNDHGNDDGDLVDVEAESSGAIESESDELDVSDGVSDDL